MSDETYAGDLTPKQTWKMLAENLDAVLIDVRTEAEYAWVGTPDLSSLGKDALNVPWKMFPDMELNLDFVDHVSGAVPGKNTPLMFMCRSGVRSLQAAEAMTEAGYTKCYNLVGGFEGKHDDDGHRSTVNGWKMDGLPWRQG